jgi:hypothetical protein
MKPEQRAVDSRQEADEGIAAGNMSGLMSQDGAKLFFGPGSPTERQ